MAPKLECADELMREIRERPERAYDLLAQMCVISAYIKRRANLILICEEKDVVQVSEIETCIRESLDNVRLTGVIPYLDAQCEGMIAVNDVIAVYDFFEEALEELLKRINAVMVTVRSNASGILIRIQAGLCAPLTGMQRPALAGGSVNMEVQEEDIVIEAMLPRNGVGK